MNCTAQNAGFERGFQGPPIDDVDWSVEESVDVEFQPGVFENSNRVFLVELYEHVNVASRAGLAARHGTEHGGVRDSKPPQIAFMRAECFDDGLEIHGHL